MPAAVPPHPGEDLDQVFTLAYAELRRLASAVLRDDRRASLTPTGLVNEAWIKLARNPSVAATTPLHFRRIAAFAMRQVLVESARRRLAQSRGSGRPNITFDECLGLFSSTPLDREILALESALTVLARLSPRQAHLVELRFFGGFDWSECAQHLDISEATVARDWRLARAWLSREVRHELHLPNPNLPGPLNPDL